MTNARIDQPRKPGSSWPYDPDAVELCADAYQGTVIEHRDGPGRPRLRIAFPTVGDAGNFADLARKWVHDVTLTTPITHLDQPATLVVRLLRPGRDDIAARHREKCGGCLLCRPTTVSPQPS